MKPSFISGLVAVITLALIGLLYVQSFWIGNSYDMMNEQFEQNVYASLNRVYEDIADYEIMMELREDDMPFPYRDDAARRATKADLDTIIASRSVTDSRLLLTPSEKYDYLRNVRRDVEHRRKPVPMFPGVVGMRPDTIREPSIDFAFEIQQDVNGTTVQQLTAIVHSRTEEDLRSRTDRLLRRLDRAKATIEDRINQESLEYILRSELQKADIEIPFEYAVLDAGKNAVYHSDQYTPDISEQQFVAPLFPMDVAAEPYVLSLYFPARKSFVVRSMSVMAISSVVLIAVIMVIFVLVIIVIIRQKKLADMRTDFVNNITHELKTPIATISLASQMLGDTAIPANLKNYDHLSSVISHETKRLQTQVEKVLQMAIFERGSAKFSLKPLGINKMAEKVADTIVLQVKNKSGQLLVHLDALPDTVLADEIHLTNVLFNLCDNAIKYSINEPPDITISTFNEKGSVVLQVADKGIGIAKSDQKRIFEQFYRVQGGNVHNVKGFGLGLTYVKKVVEAHHGTLEVDSELHRGTTFRIRLPQIDENE